MAEPKQLTDSAELVGKTIARVSGLDDNGPDALVFTDGSFVLFDADGDDDCWDIFPDARPAPGYTLARLGLITDEEGADRDAAERQARLAERDIEERAQFERLKAKFDPSEAK